MSTGEAMVVRVVSLSALLCPGVFSFIPISKQQQQQVINIAMQHQNWW
jgi:hypothetical protein